MKPRSQMKCDSVWAALHRGRDLSQSNLVGAIAEYHLVGTRGSGLFRPQDHGLNPQTELTPDRRGFFCVYRIVDGILLLEQVRLGAPYRELLLIGTGKGPALMGVPGRVEPEEKLRVVFSNLHASIPFSGGLLLGNDYIHALPLEGQERQLRQNTSHPAFEWDEIHELILYRGQLVEARDSSNAIAQARAQLTSAQLELGPPEWRTELTRLMSQIFRMGYD